MELDLPLLQDLSPPSDEVSIAHASVRCGLPSRRFEWGVVVSLGSLRANLGADKAYAIQCLLLTYKYLKISKNH
jgi:hypothetical protein